MLELLAESKILVRLGIPIPKVAQSALNQVLYYYKDNAGCIKI